MALWRVPDFRIGDYPAAGGIEFEVRSRLETQGRMLVAFPWLDGQPREFTVPLAAQRSLRYLVLPGAGAPRGGLRRWPGLSIGFPDLNEPGDVELLGVRIVHRNANYDSSAGFAYESLQDQTRGAFFQWAGGDHVWRARVPDRGELRFSLGTLPEMPSAESTLEVRCGGRSLSTGPLRAKEASWSDHELDLAAFAGCDAEFHLRSSSGEPTVTLWSEVRLVDRGYSGRLAFIYLVDALRTDHVEGLAWDESPIETPELLSFGAEATRFPNALANAPVTKYSAPALLTGLLPLHTGVMTSQRVPEQVTTLADRLREAGFSTLSYSVNGNSQRLRGLHKGFDRTYSTVAVDRAIRQQTPNAPRNGMLRVSSRAFQTPLVLDELLRRRDEDVFVFLHAMDTHMPYIPEEPHLGEFYDVLRDLKWPAPEDRAELWEQLQRYRDTPPEERYPDEAMRALYRGAAANADRHFGTFWDFLEQHWQSDELTFVLSADHGEHLGSHEDAPPFRHGTPMYLDVLRVPLIVAAEQMPVAVRSAPVQLADLAPTLLDLLGVDFDPLSFDGVSLVSLAHGTEVGYFEDRIVVGQALPQWSVFSGRYHGLDVMDERAKVFDWLEDPFESTPLAGPERARALAALRAGLATLPRRDVPSSGEMVSDAESLRQLKALGYVQ